MQCSWLLCLKRTSHARRCLVIAPHAGGNAQVFRDWTAFVPPDTDLFAIQYPGRGARMGEAPYTDVRAIASEVAPILMQQFPSTTVFLYGHSMGAFVVYEVAKHWEGRRGHGIGKLIVSGCRAPHYPRSQPPVYHLPHTEFLQELKALGGTPNSVLDESDLMDILVPVLRADFAAAQTYWEEQPTPLLSPIVACGGDQDPRVREDEVHGWSECTKAEFSVHHLPGDHFFPFAATEQLLSIVFPRTFL
jgi:medium-chain acyl-[acyl-carrier-protein] hydrolase